jgi:LPXTG cell wall anchor motif
MKRIILVFTAALLLTAMTVAVAPAMAQEEKKEETKTEEKKGDDKDKDKDKEKDLPKSGGLPINASLLGLGAGVLLVGGGLVAVRVARQDRR